MLVTVLLGVAVAAPGAAANPDDTNTTTTVSVRCDVAALTAAVSQANITPGPAILELAADCKYVITEPPPLERVGLLIRSDIIIHGNNATISRAAAAEREFGIMEITNRQTLVRLHDLTVTGGADFSGGGIRNWGELELVASTVSRNTAYYEGGGVDNFGSLRLVNSTVRDNTSERFAGGIQNNGTLEVVGSTVSNNTAGSSGGGMDNYGTVKLVGSTVSGNTSNTSGGDDADDIYHDIYNRGDDGGGGIYNTGHLSVIASTVTANTAPTNQGGGINNESAGRGILRVIASTVTGNNGGGIRAGLGKSTVAQTILAANDHANCVGVVPDGGHNLEDGATCGFSALSSRSLAEPRLLPLGDYGGPTATQLPRPDSPAVDAGPVSCAIEVGQDSVTAGQRGVPRPQGSACDIGAVERLTGDLGVTLTGRIDTDPNHSTIRYTATVANNGEQPVTGIALIDRLPSGVRVRAVTASQGVCATRIRVTTTLTCDLGSLHPVGTAIVTVTAEVTWAAADDPLTNTVHVIGTPNPDPDNDTASVTF